jgi:4-oxalocrotonate tautomerase
MRDCLSSEEEKRNNCYEMVDLEEEKMPIVHVNVWEGFGKEKIKTVIQEITKIFVDLGVPEHAVEVIVHEIPKSNWGIGGVPASEKFKDIA